MCSRATLARELAQLSPHFRTALAPHAEQLARRLSGKPGRATPLTRNNLPRAIAATSAEGCRRADALSRQ
jgi:hypothetical protein